MPEVLNTRVAVKCIVDGLHAILHSTGPDDPQLRASFVKILKAPKTDLITGLSVADFAGVMELTIDLFVSGDCNALPDDQKKRLWDFIVNELGTYWTPNPLLPQPFPVSSFTQPAIDCPDTRIAALVDTIREQWEDAQ
jgi:hypothetical protein